jgi:predicted enzyme related to lactoylglutathione lyase
MLNLNSVMLGSKNPEAMAAFYEKLLGKPADMAQDRWFGWSVGSSYLSIGFHSEVDDKATDSARIIFNFETNEVKEEFEKMKSAGATVVKEPYEVGDGKLLATLADPDGNYFQLMSPWK